MIDEENLTFEDGVLLCKYIYQCAVHKTLHGVMEEWEIFQKTYDMLRLLESQKTQEITRKFENQFDKRRLDELLFKFNIENVYATI